MNCRLLLTLALVGLILFVQLDAKAIKHKHSKKAHVKHGKKQDVSGADAGAAGGGDAAPAGGAAAGGAAAGGDAAPAGGDAAGAGGAAAGGAAAGGAAAGGDAAAAGGDADTTDDADTDGTAPNPTTKPNQPIFNGPVNPAIDNNLNGIDDRLEPRPGMLPGQPPLAGQAGQPAAAAAAAPDAAAEEDEGSASGQAPPPPNPWAAGYVAPQLLGGHMLPGPTPDPYEMQVSEPRYCPEPCPQECAPGCYDWCCFPSIQVPAPPMQLMMVPVNVTKPTPAPVPAPLPYPMQYGPSDACFPNPCSAKKHQVTKNETIPSQTVKSMPAVALGSAKDNVPTEEKVAETSTSNNTAEEPESAPFDEETKQLETHSDLIEKKSSTTSKTLYKKSNENPVSKFVKDTDEDDDEGDLNEDSDD